jgi:hypothetical protein
MTDQHPPHDPPQADDDDAIIELTDVVSSPATDDDEVIELTDVVQEDADDGAVIELTDVVEPAPEEAPSAETPPVEEPEIELTETVLADEDEAELEPFEDRFDPAEDENVMTQAAMEGVEESTSGDLEFAQMELDIEERKEEGLFDSLEMNMEADLLHADDETGELDFNLSTQELSDAIDLLDAKLAEEPAKVPPADQKRDITPEALDTGQLETALENVIRKMFGDKIDRLLDDAIEKTVSAEIARLKDQLLGDGPGGS